MPQPVDYTFTFQLVVGKFFRCPETGRTFEVMASDLPIAIAREVETDETKPTFWYVPCPDCNGAHRFSERKGIHLDASAFKAELEKFGLTQKPK